MLFGDARSGVFDMEKQLAALRTVPQRNGAFVSELHRIVDEVGDDLNQPVLVADHAALRVVLPEDQLDGFVLDLETERAHRLLAHAVDVHPAVIEFEGACFDLRKVQNVGYEFEQQLVVLLDDTHVLTPLPDVVRLGQQVRKSHDGVQGRADFVAHVGQKSRFEPVADLGLVLGLDQVLLGLLQLRDVEIDAYHLDLRRVGVQRIAHHIDAGPSRRFAFGRNPQVKRESVGFARLDAPDFPEYGVAVLRVHVVVNPDHLRHRRIAFLSQIMKPLRHGITVARHQVETRIAHLAEAAHQRKRTFELGKTAVSFVDLGVVDIDDHEIDQLAVHVVEHGDRRIYLHVSVLARRIVAVQPVEMVIEFERLLLPVAHVLADLAGDKRVAEEIDAQHLLLRFESEDFEVLVIEVHQIPLPVVQLDADLHVVEDVAQQLFAVEKRFVGVVHVRRVGKETDHCTAPQKLDTFGVFFMKYNYEIRLKAVKLVLEGGLSVREAGCHLGCGRSQVHLWVTLFERHGLAGLKLRHGSYSAEFKLSVLKHMHQNHLSLLETAVHFGIPGPFVIRQWERLYQNQGAEGLRRKPQRRRPAMSKSKTKKVKLKTTPHEELLKELEYLRAENAYLKKLQALVEERIVRESGKEPKPSKD
mgnify:CR=1 FL=1